MSSALRQMSFYAVFSGLTCEPDGGCRQAMCGRPWLTRNTVDYVGDFANADHDMHLGYC